MVKEEQEAEWASSGDTLHIFSDSVETEPEEIFFPSLPPAVTLL